MSRRHSSIPSLNSSGVLSISSISLAAHGAFFIVILLCNSWQYSHSFGSSSRRVLSAAAKHSRPTSSFRSPAQCDAIACIALNAGLPIKFVFSRSTSPLRSRSSCSVTFLSIETYGCFIHSVCSTVIVAFRAQLSVKGCCHHRFCRRLIFTL